MIKNVNDVRKMTILNVEYKRILLDHIRMDSVLSDTFLKMKTGFGQSGCGIKMGVACDKNGQSSLAECSI